MAIVKMKKLRVIAMAECRRELLHQLQRLGCVEIREPESTGEAWEGLLRRESAGPAETKAALADARTALAAAERYGKIKGGLLIKRRPVTEAEFSAAAPQARETVGRITARLRTIADLQGETARLAARQAALLPWKDLDLPLEAEGTEHVLFRLGTCPRGADLGELRVELENLPAELLEISSDRQQRYLLLVCHRAEEEPVMDLLRGHGFSAVAFPGIQGTAAEELGRIEGRMEEVRRRQAEAEDAVAQAAGQRDTLQTYTDYLEAEAAKEHFAGQMLTDGTVVFFEGWTPAERQPEVGALLDSLGCAWETEDPKKEEYPQVPVQLKNNALTAPYSVVTEMYSLPAYDGLDPNPFIMPFFALFFGIMFADMGYGLLMVLGGLLGIKLLDPKGTMRNMLAMVAQCGVSTFLIGFLTGGFFGDAVSVLGSIFGQEWSLVPHLGDIRIGEIVISLPLNLLEGNNPLYVLVLAMVLGAIHLFFGVCIGVYLNVRDGNWVDAIFDLSWWVIFAGAAVMVLAESPVVLIIGVAAMVITTFLKGKGIGRITGLFGAVYNGVTGYLGDILSYSRLMALMLAGSVIASVFNQLGSLGGIFLFIPVFLIGHVLNFGLNLIGCFVHTMRLQFLEFFGKWYREGGRPFQPLKYDTKFVDIKED